MTEQQEQQPLIVETPEQKTKRLREEREKEIERQLGLRSRTASHRLNRLILISLLRETGRDTCCRCGVELDEHAFSIDHMEHWFHSDDPKGKYFNIKNIDFSCKSCNSSYTRAKYGTSAYEERLERVTGWSPRKPLLSLDEIRGRNQPVEPNQPATRATAGWWSRLWASLFDRQEPLKLMRV